MRRWIRTLSAGLAIGLIPAVGSAVEQKPLPDFQVLAADGTSVRSAELSVQERWVLIYAIPDCRTCDQVLQALKTVQDPKLAARTVIVVGARLDVAHAYVEKKLPKEAGGVAWFADAQGKAWQALEIPGTPFLLGVRRGWIEWALSGTPKEAGALTSALRSWVEY